ncbi:MAG: hypothetical protein Kow0031_05380 [Anaerolineae bacterium]
MAYISRLMPYTERISQQEFGLATVGPGRQRAMMDTKPNHKTEPNQPTVYQIRLAGHLSEEWAAWFEGMTITLEETGQTLLTGPVVDQAALHGLFKKVRDLGAPLLSVTRLEPGQTDTP